MSTRAWEISGCTVADAAAFARNNMSAFWEDPTWILLWPKDVTLDFLIEQSTKRHPQNLLRDRAAMRHEKAIDPVTGAVVGYARWVLPEGYRTVENGEPAWAEAQVPAVSKQEEERFRALGESAWWEYRTDMSSLDDANHVVMRRILSERPHLKLDYLAVHPENKGKGIASALVESGLRYADRAQLPVFVMAFKAGRGIYARLGFDEVERVIQDDSRYGGSGEYGAYFMVRECEGPGTVGEI